ncbi:hypothetical protein T10_5307 [Trichinella papuae]|uniref:Uncharacterized protein n=1 Tax=Trichinella papuae TaxID=268474 RepID=A0A0V1N536_9BILA|nr:hypothetical protein T10_5307 [Trichinella papuae]
MSRKKNRPVFVVCTLNLATFLETRPLKATIHAVSKLKQKCRHPKHIALVATTRRLEMKAQRRCKKCSIIITTTTPTSSSNNNNNNNEK